MTAPDHLRITGPEDILGFIPHSLGYWPENSLVAMTMQGKRLGATLRVDLPALGGPSSGASGRRCTGGEGGGTRGGRGAGGDAAEVGRGVAGPKRRARSGRGDTLAGFARHVVSYLQADDAADGTLLAFFTDTDTGAGTNSDADGASPAWAELLRELELALEAAGLPLRDAWIVGAEIWRNAYCSDPECCGPAGRPVEQIRNSRLNAEMVYRGSSVGAAPGTHGTLPVPGSVDPAVRAAESGWAEQFFPRRRDRAQFAQVLDVWTMVLQAATARERPLGLVRDGLAPDGLAQDGLVTDLKAPGTQAPGERSPGPLDARNFDPQSEGQPLELSPELAGYLRASLCTPSWRDAVLVMAAAGRTAAVCGAEEFGIFDTQAGSGSRSATRPGPAPGPIPERLPGSTSRSPSAPRPGARAGSTSGSPCAPLPPLPDVPIDGRAAAAAAPGPAAPDLAAPDLNAPGPAAAAAAGPDAGAVPGYGEVLLGLAPSVPDWALMVGLDRVLELLGRLGDGEPTAAAVTARGWIEWCRGRGSYADALYRQALQDHPGYRLAELLAELGRRGTLCGWAARRDAAWQKFAPDAA